MLWRIKPYEYWVIPLHEVYVRKSHMVAVKNKKTNKTYKN